MVSKKSNSDDALTFKVRRAYTLRDRGYSKPEIAKELGVTTAWVKRRFQQSPKT